MQEFKPDLKKFAIDFVAKRIAVIAVIFVVCNVWLIPIFNLFAALSIVSWFYYAWLNEKDKYAFHLFRHEEIKITKDGAFWTSIAIEGLVLMVGMHYLYKGFTTVTGVTESWFNIEASNKFLHTLLSVSFIMALAIMLGMLLMLYFITRSPQKRRLVTTYVLIDIVILMPFNFMFSYENNQRDNLTVFYADALPILQDEYTNKGIKRAEIADNIYGPQKQLFDQLEADIEKAKADVTAAENNATTVYSSESYLNKSPEDRRSVNSVINTSIRRTKDRLNALVSKREKISPEFMTLRTRKENFDTMKSILARTGNIVTEIKNGKIKKENKYDSIVVAKEGFMTIYYKDSAMQTDTAVSYNMAKLAVTTETPTDGFISLLHDFAKGVLKNKNNNNNTKAISNAQKEWNALLPQKRWFSFLFSISIDLVPLIIALSYAHFKRMMHANVE